MLALVLVAQLASSTVSPPESIYATSALRSLIAQAAVANHEPPPEFRGYHSRIETELSLLIRDTLGRERAAQIEQLGADATWQRMGEYQLHIVGYRSQSVGVPYSSLSIVRGWTLPSLYGERLLLGAYFGGARARARENQLVTVHPFAIDRDRFYRFAGGDTVTTLRLGDRSIPVARIHVTPYSSGPSRLGLFEGEIDLDAERHQIVRMRGRFVILGTRTPGSLTARLPGIIAVAYGEFVNAEVDGKYWLPAFQRTEFQASIALLGQSRSVFRLVSRFDDYRVDAGGAFDTTGVRPRLTVTYASQDSISSYAEWRRGLGDATSAVRADDFDDVGPDSWRPDGPPRLEFAPTKTGEILRFNRVEGLFTGVNATVHFRDVFPGLSAGVFGGWAWAEHTARGGARSSLARGPWIAGLRIERELASTNDFALPLEEDGGGIGALLGGIDDYDYVDRKTLRFSFTRSLGGFESALMTVQLGAGHDRGAVARVERGLFGGSIFRPNRGVTEGSYALGAAELEIHPNVTGDFVQPGVGGRLRYEAGVGDLDWQRTEVSVSARRYFGPFQLAMHADGGIVFGSNPPPQQLFELGGGEVLPGYRYKEFAGDRAALFRTYLSYRFPLWRSPISVFRRFYLPGFGPGLAIGAQGGWSELSSAGARQSALALGVSETGEPLSVATGGGRATVGVGVTFFSDIVHVGVARPVDRAAPWRWVVGFGQAF
jgi:hypothetical protein